MSTKRGFARSEEEWVAQYEANQAAVLGDPSYRLPTQDELLEEHRERDRKKGRDAA